MINAKRANALLWTGNLALILGIASFSLSSFILRETAVGAGPASEPLPRAPSVVDVRDTVSLAGLPNPLKDPIRMAQDDSVCLIGIDGIAGDPDAATAYLFLAGRKLFVNAYAGEPIREAATGREVSELSGWRLKSITSRGALFSTPQGELTLTLAPGPASLVAAASGPAEVRTALDVAAELLKDGRVEDACIVLEEAFWQRPTTDAVYAFMKRVGEDVIASMMNSRDGRIKAIGYRLFELAKPSGDRVRTSNA
jgi:hypothetical protein